MCIEKSWLVLAECWVNSVLKRGLRVGVDRLGEETGWSVGLVGRANFVWFTLVAGG